MSPFGISHMCSSLSIPLQRLLRTQGTSHCMVCTQAYGREPSVRHYMLHCNISLFCT